MKVPSPKLNRVTTLFNSLEGKQLRSFIGPNCDLHWVKCNSSCIPDEIRWEIWIHHSRWEIWKSYIFPASLKKSTNEFWIKSSFFLFILVLIRYSKGMMSFKKRWKRVESIFFIEYRYRKIKNKVHKFMSTPFVKIF